MTGDYHTGVIIIPSCLITEPRMSCQPCAALSGFNPYATAAIVTPFSSAYECGTN